MERSQMEYDRMGVGTFSPNGRLFQVEYAREAVKRGTTSIGIVCRDGVVLISHKRIGHRLVVPSSVEKLFTIDEGIACAVSGLVADARVLVGYAREVAQEHRYLHDERISVRTLTAAVCDIEQMFTQRDGLRPFGVSFLLAGRDDEGFHLFETDPSGSYAGQLACAIGSGYMQAKELLEEQYSPELSMDDGLTLGVKAIAKSSEGTLDVESIEAGAVHLSETFAHFREERVKKAIIAADGTA